MKACPDRYDAAVHAALALHFAEQAGVPRKAMEQAADLPPDLSLDDFTRVLPAERVIAALEEALARTGDARFGLHMGQRTPATLMGLVGYVLVNLPSLRAQLEMSYNACQQLTNLFTVEMAFDREPARLALHPVVPVTPALAQLYDFHLAALPANVRLYIDPDFHPLSVSFAHPAPDDVTEYEAHFRCPLSFDAGSYGVEFERGWLALASNEADPRLREVLQPYVEEKLRQAPHRHTATERVRSVLLRRLGTAPPTLASVARELGYRPRTLQQRLAQEGVTFRQVLDGVRHQLADEALTTGNEPVDALGARLGYADAASFIRAFSRWTGTTPQAYRNSLQH